MFPTFLVRRSARVSATPPTKTAWQASAIGGLADAGADNPITTGILWGTFPVP
jgi:hypothetical protein